MAKEYYKDTEAKKQLAVINKINRLSMNYDPLVNYTSDYNFKHKVYNLLNKIMDCITIMG